MLIETVVLALVISFLQRGRLANLKDLPIKWMGLAVVAFALQLLIDRKTSILISQYLTKQVLHDLSYCFLLIFLVRNYSLSGMRCITVGVLLNFLVIALNSGAMPVDPTMLPEQHRQLLALGEGGTHTLLSAQTNLQLLADRIYVYLPLIKGQILSIGDVFIDLGCFYLIYSTAKNSKDYRIKSVLLRYGKKLQQPL